MARTDSTTHRDGGARGRRPRWQGGTRGLMAAAALLLGITAAPGVAHAQSNLVPSPLESSGSLVEATGSGAQEPARPAPEGGARLVTLGDSTMAGTNLPFVDGGHACYRSTERYVAKIARSMGIYNTADFQDTSCWGGTVDSRSGLRLVDQAAFHRDAGSFGPRTEHVLIQAGLNDEWGTPGVDALKTATRCVINVIEGCDYNAIAQGRAQDPRAITAEAYAQRAKQAIDYIKFYAPNAKISLVGYPTYFAPGDRTCVSVLGLPVEQPRDQIVPDLFNNLNEAQRGAAEQLGINFIDLKTPTALHGGCTAQPWVGGVLDPASGFNGVPVHLNGVGEAAVATIVRAQM